MLASACLASPAAAQGLDQLDGWFDKLHRRIVVEPDGRFTETIDDVFVIAPRDDALPDIVQRVLHWNGSAGSMQVLEAATLKADGTRIEAPPDMRFEDLPAEVVHQTKRLIVDSIGCALGGYRSEPAVIARDIDPEHEGRAE